MFHREIYIERRKSLKRCVSSGLILLQGNGESSINYADNHYPFRQDSTFLYYTGLNKPNLILLIDVDADKEILFADDPTLDEIVWTGSAPSREMLAELSGISFHRSRSELILFFRKNLRDRILHFLPSYRAGHILNLQNWAGMSREEIETGASLELINAIVNQRSYKSKEELKQLDEAVTITSKMHIEAMKCARPGMKEFELMSRVHQKALELNGQLAFPIILTINGHILHNHHYGNTIGEGDLILCDAGAENSMGYSGDITRTFPAGGKFTSIQKTVYEIVLNSQQAAVEALKPGVRFLDIHLLACRKLYEGLKDLGIVEGDPEEAVAAGAHTLFFQAGLGHMMGLDVHDMESLGEQNVGYNQELKQSDRFGLKSLRLGRELEAGFVVTVEPGIYFIPTLIDHWKQENRLAQFIRYGKLEQFRQMGGFRVEDDYAIITDGARLLGQPVPKSIPEIEEVRVRAVNTASIQ